MHGRNQREPGRGPEGEEGRLGDFLYVWPGGVPTLNSNENFRNVILPKCACVYVWGVKMGVEGFEGKEGSHSAAKLNT